MNGNFESIVSLALSGNKNAYETLYNMTKNKTFYVALCITGNRQDAFNIIRESYVYAFNNLQTLRNSSRFDTWINQIVDIKCKNFIMKENPALFNDLTEIDRRSANIAENVKYTPQQYLDEANTSHILINDIKSLNADCLLCILMFYYQELSINEIAETLRITENNVAYKIYSARRKLESDFQMFVRKGEIFYNGSPITILQCVLNQNSMSVAPPTYESIFSYAPSPNTLYTGETSNGFAGKFNRFFSTAIGKVSVVIVAALLLGGGIITATLIMSNNNVTVESDSESSVVSNESESSYIPFYMKNESSQEESKPESKQESSESSVESSTLDKNKIDDTYIFAESSVRKLGYEEVLSKSQSELNYARNEIFARHGRKFTDSSLQEYFNKKTWYNGNIEADVFDENINKLLNSTEEYNLSLIIEAENSMKHKNSTSYYQNYKKYYDSSCIFPYSSIEKLTRYEVQLHTKEELNYARNEIYARNGRKFKDSSLQAYFNNKSWYYGTIEAEDFTESMLNDIEIYNINLISDVENTHSYSTSSYYYYDNSAIFPNSSVRRLTESEVACRTKEDLNYARNEIYARNGRKFKDSSLQAYFNSKSWYHGTIEAEDFTESMLNDIERYNISLIQKYE